MRDVLGSMVGPYTAVVEAGAAVRPAARRTVSGIADVAGYNSFSLISVDVEP